MEPTKSEFIEVRESGIHNKGIFAAKDILDDTKIIEYVGEKVSKEEGDDRCDISEEESKKDNSKGMFYVFELNDHYDIDGDVDWNTAKYINHSCDPNCEIDIEDDKIWVTALRDIKDGEELTYDYNFDEEDFEKYPCKCGSKNCIGYMVGEECWPELKKKFEEKGMKFPRDIEEESSVEN